MFSNIFLALYGLAAMGMASPAPKSTVVERDEDDVFTFTGAGGTTYHALIRSQTNRDESPYTVDDGIRAWDDATNEIAQNLQATDLATQTDLTDGNTIIVSGNMDDNQQWGSVGDSNEWGSIIAALSVRTIQEDGPEYFYVTLGTDEDLAVFFASISLSWINTA